MIHGVIIKQLVVHKDIPDSVERAGSGFLMEVLRADENLMHQFGQTVFTVASGKGMVKGFHWHKRQDDLWFVASGRAKIVMHDLREDSPTKGETHVVEAGTDDYKLIVIPHGVAHGYKVMTDEPVLLFYHVTETYNPSDPDEQRIPYNDPSINFDWDKNE